MIAEENETVIPRRASDLEPMVAFGAITTERVSINDKLKNAAKIVVWLLGYDNRDIRITEQHVIAKMAGKKLGPSSTATVGINNGKKFFAELRSEFAGKAQ